MKNCDVLLVLCLGTLLLASPARAQSGKDFELKVLDARGYPGETVTTSVLFSNRSEFGVRGWQIALTCEGSTNVRLAAAESGTTVMTALGGEPAETNIVKVHPEECWVQQGVIFSMEGDITLPPGESYNVLNVSFELLENEKESCEARIQLVRFPDSIGEPPIWTAVDVDGTPIRDLALVNGTIRCREINDCCPEPPECPSPRFPSEPGFDYMETTTPSFRFSLYGEGTYDVDESGLVGPTIVARSGRGVDRNGCPFVATHLKQLALEGKIAGEGWRVVVVENNDEIGGISYQSTGNVISKDCGNPNNDFPARSEFHLHFKVLLFQDPDSDEPTLVLFNKKPKIQRNVICELPPINQKYPYEPPEPIDLYDAKYPDLPPVGQILGAHNPEHVVVGPRVFIRGDCYHDGLIDITDVIHLLGYLFLGQARPTCLAACDVDANDSHEVTDAVYLLNYLFLGGKEPPPPFKPFCGRVDPDWVSAVIGCQEYPMGACDAYLILNTPE